MARVFKPGEWVRPDVSAQIMAAGDVELKCCGRCHYVAVRADSNEIFFPTAWKCTKHDIMTDADSSCVDFAPDARY